ncbi:D-serine ammonia-lyase [Aureococcus anophagefferens]|nr:D-serine ammonia-lyase [Aureococcus anophagefferens]
MSELKLHKPQRKQVRTRSVKSLRTPNLICYEHVLKANAARMRSRAERLGCELRPHFKTVKTLGAATIATGGTKRKLTVSTLAEAFFLEAGGFDDIVYAVPLTPDKIDDVEDLSCRLEKFYVMVDHMDQVLVGVDCGYHRDGVDPDDPESLKLVEAIVACEDLEFAGLYTHGGHSYDCASVEDVRAIARAERDNTVAFADKLRLGSCASVDDVAVRVITRVVGHYKRSNILLIDAGWTGLSAQGKECGYGAIPKHPELAIVTLKQECGEITTRDGSPLNFESYPIGTILEVAPHHSCAATHQHAECHVVRDEFSGLILDSWPICKGW